MPPSGQELRAIAPLYFVRGNNDKDWAANLPSSLSMEIDGGAWRIEKITLLGERK